MSETNPEPAPNSSPQPTTGKRLKVSKEAVNVMLDKLAQALQDGVNDNIKHGLFHASSDEHDALWVATDLMQKSNRFSRYTLTFYHQGMGEGTNTCAVTFIEKSSDAS